VRSSKINLRIARISGSIKARLCRALRGTASRLVSVLLLTCPALAEGKFAANLELVLALDCSASVDDEEFALQIAGIAAAFQDRRIQQAVENLKPFGVAITVVQWGADGETRTVVPFALLQSARDAKAFGFRAGLIPRWLRASETSIASAIGDSLAAIEDNEFEGQRKVIDVSGDGQHNGSADLEAARLAAKQAGITVNGLAIETDDGKLTSYFEHDVIVGADAFVETARDYDDFARAIREKLLRELTPLGS
jgi:Protein of unknown function (DUF1194)